MKRFKKNEKQQKQQKPSFFPSLMECTVKETVRQKQCDKNREK